MIGHCEVIVICEVFKTQEKNMLRILLLCVVCALTLSACEKQKQASAEVGAVPKQIVDQAAREVSAASAASAEQLKAIENIDSTPESADK
jgi:hypothetical protein